MVSLQLEKVLKHVILQIEGRKFRVCAIWMHENTHIYGIKICVPRSCKIIIVGGEARFGGEKSWLLLTYRIPFLKHYT